MMAGRPRQTSPDTLSRLREWWDLEADPPKPQQKSQRRVPRDKSWLDSGVLTMNGTKGRIGGDGKGAAKVARNSSGKHIVCLARLDYLRWTKTCEENCPAERGTPPRQCDLENRRRHSGAIATRNAALVLKDGCHISAIREAAASGQ